MGFSKEIANSFTNTLLEDGAVAQISTQTLLRSTMVIWGYTSQLTNDNIDNRTYTMLSDIHGLLLTLHEFRERTMAHKLTVYHIQNAYDKLNILSCYLLSMSKQLTSQFLEIDRALIDLKSILQRIMKVYRNTNNLDIDYNLISSINILQYASTIGYYVANSGSDQFSITAIEQISEIEEVFHEIICGYQDIMICQNSIVCDAIKQTKCFLNCEWLCDKYHTCYDYQDLRTAMQDGNVIANYKELMHLKYFRLLDKLRHLDADTFTDSWKFDFTNYIITACHMLDTCVE